MIANGRAYLQSGAGIVADSDPEKEYEETLHKARALHHALELAAGLSVRLPGRAGRADDEVGSEGAQCAASRAEAAGCSGA